MESQITRQAVEAIILDALRMCNEARLPDQQIPVANDTPLFGRDAHLDSMGLVALLLDIEDALVDQGHDVALSDEKAMSEKNSPFRDVQTLADYIEKQLS
ncbi:MAG: hypothetical protein AAGI72_11830 [Pseudomonadota bacterium]